jgi:hypothetical protein
MDKPITSQGNENVVIKGEAFGDFDRVFMMRRVYMGEL